MRRREYPRVQSKAIAAGIPRFLLLWVLATLALAVLAALDGARTRPVDADSHFTLQNAPAIVQALIERYAPR